MTPARNNNREDVVTGGWATLEVTIGTVSHAKPRVNSWKSTAASITCRASHSCFSMFHSVSVLVYLGLAIQGTSASVDLTDRVSVGRPHCPENLLEPGHQLGFLCQAHFLQLLWQHLVWWGTGGYIYILKASWLWQQKCKCYFITKQKHIVHCVRVLPTSRAKKAWTLLVLSKQSRQLVLMVPPWVLKKHIIMLRSNKKNVIVFNTFVEVLTLWFPSLLCSRRSRTLLWTCWGKVWGHCAVCLPCLPSHFDGSQSSPSSLLLHALRPSGDSENNREEEDIQTQCENDAHAKCVLHPQRNISLHSLMQNQQTVFQRNLWRALLIAASLHQYKKRLTFKFCRTYFVSIINK